MKKTADLRTMSPSGGSHLSKLTSVDGIRDRMWWF